MWSEQGNVEEGYPGHAERVFTCNAASGGGGLQEGEVSFYGFSLRHTLSQPVWGLVGQNGFGRGSLAIAVRTG